MTARHELLEAAGYLETHGCLPEGLATTAVREVVDPLMPGDKAEIVVALQVAAEADARPPAPVTTPTPDECDPERVETVARALAHSDAVDAAGPAVPDLWKDASSAVRREYRRLAAAAIAALPPSPAAPCPTCIREGGPYRCCPHCVDDPDFHKAGVRNHHDLPCTPCIRAALASPAPAPQGGGQS